MKICEKFDHFKSTEIYKMLTSFGFRWTFWNELIKK